MNKIFRLFLNFCLLSVHQIGSPLVLVLTLTNILFDAVINCREKVLLPH